MFKKIKQNILLKIGGWPVLPLLAGASLTLVSALAMPAGKSVPIPEQGKLKKLSIFLAAPKDSIDAKTGLIVATGHQLVVKNCLKCHSPQLISAKRATREGWLTTIRWMQHNQGLWDLGKEEAPILDYLSKNYAPTYEGRRPGLKNIEWYKLEY